MRRRLLLALGGVAALTVMAVPAGAAVERASATQAVNSSAEIIHVGPDLNDGEPLPVIVGPATQAPQEGRRRAAAHPPVVGETRLWVGLDDVQGAFYSKEYRLRGLGEHVEIWVATGTRTFRGITSTDTDFQAGDCRNGVRTQITDAQVDYLRAQFDANIYPKESAAFSVPPDRDGSNALLGAPFDSTGDGDDIVVLVDNVRDDNFYDLNNTQAFSYIAGFFSSQLNTLFDRNIMSIDAFDWLHRTGANPPHEPVPGDNCASAPARPFLYEGVFAHEYQHLLEQYEDPDETTWINEGLSDWAQTLTGYVDPSRPVTDIGFDSHIQCFLGYLGIQTDANPIPRLTSGPENSLTRWEDQGPGEILCDYGAAYTMMEYLAGQFGQDIMTVLHRGDTHGLTQLQDALNAEGSKRDGMQVIRDWTLMVAVDGLIDDGARILGPYPERLFTAPTLDATINWDTEHAFSTPGAPSNGSDYVRFRNAAGAYVSGGNITSLSFDAAETLPAKPIAWSVAADPPFTPGDPALFSGAGNNRDEMIIRSVTVPTGAGATLTFDALWNQELGWDFLFAQVSTDGGSTYSSLTCTDTTTDTNPDALPTAKENVPGFTSYSGGWRAQTCSLAAYAGQTVLLAFRTFNDPAVLGESTAVPPGAWVDDVSVGGTLISDGSTLAGWQSRTQVSPTSVSNFTVQILSIAGNKITVKRLPLTGDFAVHGAANVEKYIDRKADFVAAIVTYEDPAERSDQYAPYTLTVNGVVQPGGGM